MIKTMFLPILSAILAILAFLPFDFFWIFGFVFLAPLFVFFIKENGFWKLLAGSFIFRFIFALGAVYYTLEPIAWFSSILIFLGLPISIFAVKKIKTSSLVIHNSLFIILPFLWIFFDHFQARYSPLPTSIIAAGDALGSSPFLGLANFGGLILLTFFAALINILIAFIIIKIKRRKSGSVAVLIIIAIIIFISWQVSQFELRKNAKNYAELKNSLKIAAVSTNEKFTAEDLKKLKNELSGKKIDLLIFPEDIFGEYFDETNILTLKNLVQDLKTDLVATFDTYEQDGKRYNSTVLIDESGEIIDIYHKNRLTFIGEYWPFKEWRPSFFDRIAELNPQFKNYAVFNPQDPYYRGEKKLLNLGQIKFASLICLEIHYPTDLKEYKNMGARFIVNPTSNRWLDLGIKHFLYLTNNLRRIESVWLKVPIVSSGVKDFSGLILPNGEINLTKGLFLGEIRY